MHTSARYSKFRVGPFHTRQGDFSKIELRHSPRTTPRPASSSLATLVSHFSHLEYEA